MHTAKSGHGMAFREDDWLQRKESLILAGQDGRLRGRR